MKFLHIADLHIGRRIGDVPLDEDQKYVLDQIIETADEEGVDGVLIAGDIYQKAQPQSSAMTMFNDFVTALADRGIWIFAISGNHDSGQRISYLSSLIKNSGMYVTERFEGVLQQIELKDEYGSLVVNMLPFIRPVNVRHCFPEEEINSYDEAVSAVLNRSEIDTDKRNILIMHQFITGAEISDSEERTVGGVDNISGGLFDAFDYVALGHIHKPQSVGRKTMRYSGSPLKYSLSEAEHNKSITIVELKEKGSIEIKTRPVKALHDIRVVKGLLEDVLAMPYSEDFVQVELNDELVPPDARVSVATVFPNMIKFMVINSTTKIDLDITHEESIEGKDELELFSDFYRLQKNNEDPTEEQLELVRDILKELEDDRYEAD